MKWIVFNYSLPTKQGASSRVALWRRLQRLGSISIAGGAYTLPAREECIEAFQWLAQEIHSASGQALIIHVERFEGLTEPQIVELFNSARTEDYEGLSAEIDELNKANTNNKSEDSTQIQGVLAKLRRRYADIARIDYFHSPRGQKVAQSLDDLEKRISPTVSSGQPIPHVDIDQYKDKNWVTRPHPYVDRLACIWLIRHFINPQALVRYSTEPKESEVAFDMTRGEFGHRGNLCTFETMNLAFDLDDPGLRPLAEIVHEIDLRDGRYLWPETSGIERILTGWTKAGLPDKEMESKGITLFEGLYTAFTQEFESKIRPQDI